MFRSQFDVPNTTPCRSLSMFRTWGYARTSRSDQSIKDKSSDDNDSQQDRTTILLATNLLILTWRHEEKLGARLRTGLGLYEVPTGLGGAELPNVGGVIKDGGTAVLENNNWLSWRAKTYGNTSTEKEKKWDKNTRENTCRTELPKFPCETTWREFKWRELARCQVGCSVQNIRCSEQIF